MGVPMWAELLFSSAPYMFASLSAFNCSAGVILFGGGPLPIIFFVSKYFWLFYKFPGPGAILLRYLSAAWSYISLFLFDFILYNSCFLISLFNNLWCLVLESSESDELPDELTFAAACFGYEPFLCFDFYGLIGVTPWVFIMLLKFSTLFISLSIASLGGLPFYLACSTRYVITFC